MFNLLDARVLSRIGMTVIERGTEIEINVAFQTHRMCGCNLLVPATYRLRSCRETPFAGMAEDGVHGHSQ
jgi:hypothetical protein